MIGQVYLSFDFAVKTPYPAPPKLSIRQHQAFHASDSCSHPRPNLMSKMLSTEGEFALAA